MMVTFSVGLIVFSYTIVTCKTIYELPKPNQTSTTKKMLERPIFLNMTSFVEVEIGQEAVLECRVDNLVSKYLVSMIEIIYWFFQQPQGFISFSDFISMKKAI